MTYLIISIYDGGYVFGVLDNGKYFSRRDISEKANIADMLYDIYNKNILEEYLKEHYREYDLVVICEDGYAEKIIERRYLNGSKKKDKSSGHNG